MPADSFLRLDGFQGLSRHPQHLGEVELAGFRWYPTKALPTGPIVTSHKFTYSRLMFLVLEHEVDAERLLGAMHARTLFLAGSVVKYSYLSGKEVPERRYDMQSVKVVGPTNYPRYRAATRWADEPGVLIIVQCDKVEVQSFGPPPAPPHAAADAVFQIMKSFMLVNVPSFPDFRG